MSILLIARLTIKEAARKRLLVLAVAASVFFLAIFGVGLNLLFNEVKSGAARSGGAAALFTYSALMTVMGFYFVNFLAGVSAIFVSVNAISAEIDSGTVHALLARPVRRRDVVLGKWLGYAAVLSAYVVAMTVGLLAIIFAVTGTMPPAPVATIALMVWTTILLLSMSILGGTFLSGLANGVGLFLLYGLAWLAGLVEGIGGLVHNQTMVNVGIVVSLIMPSDVMWRAASYYLQSPAMVLLSGASASGLFPFASTDPPTPALLVYVLVYTVAALAGGVLVFSRRDL